MRKRGKSRLSSATKRATRYRKKWTPDSVTKRAKVLLPYMVINLEDALVPLDQEEQLQFEGYLEIGLPIDLPTPLHSYYMMWAKKRCAIGLRFNGTTREEEWALLDQEFITRGLDPEVMDNLKTLTHQWVYENRRELAPQLHRILLSHYAVDVPLTLETPAVAWSVLNINLPLTLDVLWHMAQECPAPLSCDRAYHSAYNLTPQLDRELTHNSNSKRRRRRHENRSLR